MIPQLMAAITQEHGFSVYTIQSPDGKTKMSFVPEKGGVASSLIMTYQNLERELLFQHDYFWEKDNTKLPGAWPFIFPICGRLERHGNFGHYLYDGRVYNMEMHGFAHRMAWKVKDAKDTNKISLLLQDTPATLRLYPFYFQIELNYELTNQQLICRQIYTNTGDGPLPYAAGFHPYFLTPKLGQGKEKIILNYTAKRRFQYNKNFTDLIGEQSLLAMPISITDAAIHEQLVQLGSNKVITLTYGDGFKLYMEAIGENDENMFSYVQVYSPADKSFVCVEPWMSFPNALNTVAGMRWLQPQQSESAVLKVWQELR